MRLLFYILTNLILFAGHAQDSSFVNGNRAYAAGDYKRALSEYNTLIGDEQMSASLYYNLGNTYYKLDEIGEAIWAYEKALKINPGNANTLSNLALANTKTPDQLDQTDVGINNWLAINFFNFSINFWSYVSIVLGIMLALSIYFYRSAALQKVKNMALSASFILGFLFVLTVFVSAKHKSYILNRSTGVVVSEYVDVKPSPSETAPSAFQLFEGTKVELKRANDQWIEVSVNDNTGWILKEGIWEL